jgi:acyl carrier protein
MRESIEDALIRIIATQAHLEPSLIVRDATLSDLGVTSLDLVSIISEIEDEYGVTIQLDAVEAWNNLKTVADLIALGQSLGLEGRTSDS